MNSTIIKPRIIVIPVLEYSIVILNNRVTEFYSDKCFGMSLEDYMRCSNNKDNVFIKFFDRSSHPLFSNSMKEIHYDKVDISNCCKDYLFVTEDDISRCKEWDGESKAPLIDIIENNMSDDEAVLYLRVSGYENFYLD